MIFPGKFATPFLIKHSDHYNHTWWYSQVRFPHLSSSNCSISPLPLSPLYWPKYILTNLLHTQPPEVHSGSFFFLLLCFQLFVCLRLFQATYKGFFVCAIHYPIIHYLLSTIYNALSTIHYHLSNLHYRLSTVHFPISTIHYLVLFEFTILYPLSLTIVFVKLPS